ncbi:MAG: family 10 glycosylhydrolase, partial [Clostridiales bacterium]|nr:family 10 glycosylhydrolase [Clostridiales bacterium]
SAKYNAYKNSGGQLSLADFRRQNVSAFVSGMYNAVKSIDKTVRVGASPQSNIEKVYSQHYADVYLWCSKSGYIDYIAPQVYFALNHQTAPFKTMVEKWEKITTADSVKLLIGIAPYKCGKVDNNAGNAYKNEWVNNSNILAEEYSFVKNSVRCSGALFFSYSYMVAPYRNGATAQTEIENLKKVL